MHCLILTEVVNGAGSTLALPLYSEWSFAYSFLQKDTSIQYNGIGSGLGVSSLVQSKSPYIFAGTDTPVDKTFFKKVRKLCDEMMILD